MGQRILVTGPARSGKSEWAERLATQSGKAVIYIATAQSNKDDLEWQARILQHQQRRPPHWTTLEAPTDLFSPLNTALADQCLLIDSLGTWLVNYLEATDADWQKTVEALMDSLQQSAGTVILVAEETGWGVIPAYPIGRLFRDRLGSLTRRIGAIASAVYLVTGGHALNLSQLGTPLPHSD